MIKKWLILIIMVLLISANLAVLVSSDNNDSIENDITINKSTFHADDTSGTQKNIRGTHTVLAELGCASDCPYCPSQEDNILNVAGDYEFIQLACSHYSPSAGYNQDITNRLNELGISSYPTSFWDGGFSTVTGGVTGMTSLQNAYDSCANRNVADVNLDLSVSWIGDAEIEIDMDVINNEASTYNGHLHIYVVEMDSRWTNYNGNPHLNALLSLSYNSNINVAAGNTWNTIFNWDGDTYGYGDISPSNIKVIAAVFDQSSSFTDEVTSALPILNQPSLSFTPTSYNFGVVQPGQTYQTTFEIWNQGTNTLYWNLSDSSSWLTYTPTTGSSTAENDIVTVTIDTTGLNFGSYLEGIDIVSNGGNDTFTVQFSIQGDSVFYAWDSSGSSLPEGPFYFSPTDPSSGTSLANDLTTVYAGTWAEDKWFAINDDAKSIVTIDNVTGATTTIGSTSIPSAYITTGMTYDPVAGILYASAGEVVGSDLYTHLYEVNMTTGATTYLGQLTSDPLAMIALACDRNGTMYGPDIIDDKLYEIDVSGLTVSEVGDLGIDLNYAQDAAFDKDNDILYLAAYTASGALYTCDTTTGATTYIGDFPGGSEVCALAIPYGQETGPTVEDLPFTGLFIDWNLVSVHFNQTVNLTDVVVQVGSTNYTWSEAVSNTIIDGNVYRWDRVAQTYVSTMEFQPGESYWLYCYQPCTLWAENITMEFDSTITSVEQDWNLIGSPCLEAVNLSDVMVTYSNMDYTWAEAISNTIIDGNVYNWDRFSQTYISIQTLNPGEGYWMYAYECCDLWTTILQP